MRTFATSPRTRNTARTLPARPFRPRLQPLEDRRLLSVSLSGDEPAPPLVGSPVTWTATATDHGDTPVYQFRVGPTGGPLRVVRAFSPGNTLTWSPPREGRYVIDVTVKDDADSPTGDTAATSYTATSRVNGPGAVVSPTSNPLVALYSVPASDGGSTRVEFRPAGSRQPWKSTPAQAVEPGTSTSLLVAGLLPRTAYLMRHVQPDGTPSAPSRFQTRSLPRNLKFPTFAVQQAPSFQGARTQNLVFHAGINYQPGSVGTLATNLAGQVAWYFDPVANNFPSYAPSLVPGGGVFLLGGNLNNVGGGTVLREVDLAGNALRETNVDAVNAQLAARGQPAIIDFHHDAQRLPSGHTAILATTPRTVPLNGTPTAYNGDMVLVLDPDFQLAWTWDPFAHLDTSRLPTLGEGPIDWMHSNSVAWSPADQNLIVSARSLDWVIKIDYAGGTGDGHVVWRLGSGGDFTLNAPPRARDPWFSHQHDARYIDNNTIVLFDNSNVRRRTNPRANSRGQVLILNESTRQATLALNADLGEYAAAVGSAQKLPNGPFVFGPGITQRTLAVSPRGTRAYALRMNAPGVQYRTYILSTLYGA